MKKETVNRLIDEKRLLMYQIADIHGMTHEQVISTSKELDELINKKNLYGSKKKTI